MSNPYAAIADFQARYDVRQINQLSNDNDNDIQNPANVQVALDDAASELDSVLTNRVGLPISGTISSVLTRLVCAMAFPALYGRRGDMPASVEKDLDWAAKWLEDFRMGRVNIPGTSRGTITVTHDGDCTPSIANGMPFFPSKGPGVGFDWPDPNK